MFKIRKCKIQTLALRIKYIYTYIYICCLTFHSLQAEIFHENETHMVTILYKVFSLEKHFCIHVKQHLPIINPERFKKYLRLSLTAEEGMPLQHSL